MRRGLIVNNTPIQTGRGKKTIDEIEQETRNNQMVLNPGQKPVRVTLEEHEAVELCHTLVDLLKGHWLERSDIQRSIWGGIVDKIESAVTRSEKKRNKP